MSPYRILRVSHINYPGALEYLYKSNPGLEHAPSGEQYRRIFESRIAYSDSFSRAMRGLGAEAEEIIFNADKAQQMWAREQGVNWHAGHGGHEILLAQIAEIRPDVVYYQGLCPFPPDVRRSLRLRFPFVRLTAMFTGYPLAPGEYSDTDILFAAAPSLNDYLNAQGADSHLMYHSFDETALDLAPPIDHDRKYDFTFMGTSGFDRRKIHGTNVPPEYARRYGLLRRLMERTNLALWENSFDEEPGRLQRIVKAMLGRMGQDRLESISAMGKEFESEAGSLVARMAGEMALYKTSGDGDRGEGDDKSLRELFPGRCHGPLFGVDMLKTLAESKVALNIHTGVIPGTIGNMRLFEAAGMGACLITDTGDNMRDLFDEGSEIVTYTSADECAEKAAFLLENPAERKKIAETGQRRVLRDHTAAHRIEIIDAIIKEKLKKGAARGVAGMDPDERLSPVHFAVVAAAKDEVDEYLKFTLPNHLSAGNAGAMKGKNGAEYFVYAPSAFMKKIEQNDGWRKLASLMNARVVPAEYAPGEAVADIKRRLITKAAAARAALTMITPGMILSDEAFPRIYSWGREQKKYLALAMDIPVRKSAYEDYFHSGGDNKCSSLALFAKGEIDQMAGSTGSRAMTYATGPRMCWRAGENGYLMRSFDYHPLMIWPRALGFLDWENIDPDKVDTNVYFNLTPNKQDVHVIGDSNELVLLRLVDDGGMREPFGYEANGRFMLTPDGRNHMRYLHYQYRLAAGEGCEGWRKAQAVSSRSVGRMMSRMEAMSAARDVFMAAKWLTGLGMK